MGLRCQTSSEQADAQSRPQVSSEMLPIHCRAWTCLSNATLDCTSPAKRFSPKTVNEKKLLSTQQILKTEQHFYNEDKNKQVHSQIKIHNEQLKNITKIVKYKKNWTKKVSKNEHRTDEDKKKQIH